MRAKDCNNCAHGYFIKCRNVECVKDSSRPHFQPANKQVAVLVKEEEEANRKAFLRMLGLEERYL